MTARRLLVALIALVPALALAHAAPAAAQAPASDLHEAPPVDSSLVQWTEARRLADEGRHAEALQVIRQALARDPDDTDLLWLEAGVTGSAGRHGEAVRLYERLLERHPELGMDLRADLGTERLKSGDPEGALFDLEVRLIEEPTDTTAMELRALALSYADRLSESLVAYDSLVAARPNDPALKENRARVLSWMGRSGEARKPYEQMLARNPNDRDATLVLARLENDAGLHRRATRRLQPLLASPDVDPEVWKTLAYSQYWSGTPGPARRSLESYRTRVPEDAEALELSRRIDGEWSPGATLGYTRSDDSDGLRTRTTRLDYRQPFAMRHVATLGAQWDNLKDPGGTIEPRRLDIALESTWNATWTTRVVGAVADLGDHAGTTGLGELAVVWRPEDRVRVDAGMSRDLIPTRQSLALGISAQTWVAGVDWRPTERTLLHADLRQRFYSDDNRVQGEVVSGRYEVFVDRTRRVAASARAQQLRTRLDLDNGYYDPPQYVEFGPGFDFEWKARPELTVTGQGWTGWQHERDAETRPFFNLSGRVGWMVERMGLLALDGGRSNSNLQTASGYERVYWAISFNRGF